MTAAGAQASELSGMRRQDRVPARGGPPAVGRRKRPKSLRVENGRRRCRLLGDRKQRGDQLACREARSKARPHHQRVVVVVEDPRQRLLGLHFFHVVLGQGHRGRLEDLGGEQGLKRFGDREGDQADAAPPGRPAHEQGGPGVVERAGQDQQFAEAALVTALRTLRQEVGGSGISEQDGSFHDGHTCRRTLRVRPSTEPNGPPVRHGMPPYRRLRPREHAGARSGRGSAAHDRRAGPRCPAGRGSARPPSGRRRRWPPHSRPHG